MLVTRPMIGKMIDKIGAKSVVMISLVFPLILITDKTSLIWISIVLFIRCTSIGEIFRWRVTLIQGLTENNFQKQVSVLIILKTLVQASVQL